MESGNDLFSQRAAPQVSLALKSLTSVFGMRTGGPLRYNHQKWYSALETHSQLHSKYIKKL